MDIMPTMDTTDIPFGSYRVIEVAGEWVVAINAVGRPAHYHGGNLKETIENLGKHGVDTTLHEAALNALLEHKQKLKNESIDKI